MEEVSGVFVDVEPEEVSAEKASDDLASHRERSKDLRGASWS